MKIHEIITEAPLPPMQEWVDDFMWVVDQANADYQEFLDDNNDQDDIEELRDFLEFHMDEQLPIEFYVQHGPSNQYIAAEAGMDDKTGEVFINIHLFADKLANGGWGPKTFKQLMLSAIKHETIHLNQYAKIGKGNLNKVKSGHQKGQELKNKTGKERDWMRSYLRDPHEIMAYGHDLAREIEDLENPQQVIRQIEQYKDELPTYERFRSIFDKNAPQIKMLLKYTTRYLNNENQ